MSVTDRVERYSPSINTLDTKDYQPLTRSHLNLFNLKNESSKSSPSSFESNAYENYNYASVGNNTISTTTTSSENDNASSSSSLESFDTESKDFKEASRFYNTQKDPNTSNSSIATLVQRKLSLSGSNSTINLQPKALQNGAVFISSQSAPQSPQSSQTIENEAESATTTPRKIKSSLKLPDLVRSKSMPNTVPKTVRFSTILTKVKTFDEHAKPSSISLDNTPEYSPMQDDDFCNNDYFGLSSAPKAFFDLRSTLSDESDESDEEKDYFSFKPASSHAKWSIKCLNFNLLSFSSNSPIESKVKLNSLCISKNSSLVGTVDVENIAFEKFVEIKFTTDNWKSIFLVTGTYDRSITTRIDRFKFEINLNQFLLLGGDSKKQNSKKGQKVVEIGLCVRYTAANTNSYYDNNNSENFKFELINQQRTLRSIKNYGSSLSRSTALSTAVPSSLSPSPSKKKLHHPPTSATFSTSNFSTALKTTTTTATTTATTTVTSKPANGGFFNGLSTTRYFSDDRDYFNHNNPVLDSSSYPQLNFSKSATTPHSSMASSLSHSPSSSSTTSFCSYKSSFGFTPAGEYPKRVSTKSDSSTFSAPSAATSTTSTSKFSFPFSSPNPSLPSPALSSTSTTNTRGTSSPYNNESMSDFLQKYCFYKSDDPTSPSARHDIVATR